MTDTFPLIDESNEAFIAPTPMRPADDEAPGRDHAEAEVEEGDDPSTETTSTGQKAAPRSINKPQIRKIILKADEVRAADKRTVKVAVQILGTTPDVVDLTVAIITAERGATQVVTDLATVRHADMFSAAAEAALLGRDRLKRVWSLLLTLGVDLPAAVPLVDTKAGLALARAVFALTDAQIKQIDDATVLIKKP